MFFQPFLWNLSGTAAFPALKRRAIIVRPFGAGIATQFLISELLLGICFSTTVGECEDWELNSRQNGWELPRKQGQPVQDSGRGPVGLRRDLADAVPKRKSSRDRGWD